MKNKYIEYKEITKEILDSVKVGDLVKINDWGRPLRVKGVSENYFVMATRCFGETLYSVCEKKPWGGIRYNSMRGGMFHCGDDNTVFGYMGSDCNFDYKFEDESQIIDYLQAFEKGEVKLSMRRAQPIHTLYVKSGR